MGLLKSLIKGDKVIWIIYGLFCVISIIEVFSAISTLTYKSGNHWYPLRTHLIFITFSIVLVLVIHRLPYKYFRYAGIAFYYGFAATLLIMTLYGIMSGGANHVNGAARWLSIGPIHLQPSEFVKMGTIVYIASILAKMDDTVESNRKTFYTILKIAGFAIVLIGVENMSTALLLCVTTGLMMIIGGIMWKYILRLVGIAVAVVVLAIGTVSIIPEDATQNIPGLHRIDTWKSRLTGFTSDRTELPEEYDIDKNAQRAHASIAIMSSNIIGKGPGNSTQRDFLSQAFSDFIFAIIVEELGVAGGVLVVLLYLILMKRVGNICNRNSRCFPVYMIMGFCILMVTQAMINMLVSVGSIPVTGQPLPLISRGGSSLLVNSMYIAIILSVSSSVELEEEKNKLNQSGDPAVLPAQSHENEPVNN